MMRRSIAIRSVRDLRAHRRGGLLPVAALPCVLPKRVGALPN
jgi:hypothetical protein